jgi:hypothetical protein
MVLWLDFTLSYVVVLSLHVGFVVALEAWCSVHMGGVSMDFTGLASQQLRERGKPLLHPCWQEVDGNGASFVASMQKDRVKFTRIWSSLSGKGLKV